MDEDFDFFLKNFGPPSLSKSIQYGVLQYYRELLPFQLFKYWENTGACSFKSGLFWIVDPAFYQETLDSWLHGSPIADRIGLSVIARNAFGSLYVWQRSKGRIIEINPLLNVLFFYSKIDLKDLRPEEEDKKMRYFFGCCDVDSMDLKDEEGNPLFQRALAKFGELQHDEMYGYFLSPELGGRQKIENIGVFKINTYHHIAQQMSPATFMKI